MLIFIGNCFVLFSHGIVWEKKNVILSEMPEVKIVKKRGQKKKLVKENNRGVK